jgi:hypothetical protein
MKIELVYADTKMTFKEHTKDGKIYVEVEPDVEYFISMQQIGASQRGVTVSKIFVDEQDLGYLRYYTKRMVRPAYQGVWNKANGVCKYIPYQ